MITFLPYPDFMRSAKVLDNQRLGKQRVEAVQVVRIILAKDSKFKYHPLTIMWNPFLHALCNYGMVVCEEWSDRGFVDHLWHEFYNAKQNVPLIRPTWIGDNLLHSSHRSNLLRKNYSHYQKFGWTESIGLDYYWPKP